MFKKVCSMILVFALVVSGITFGDGYVNKADAAIYGYTCKAIQPCGDNCSLYVYYDGINVVRGSGPMWDDFEVDDELMYGNSSYAGMRYLTFEEGITNIGGFNKDSREGYYVELPDGVEYLQDYAFANSNLIDILFADALETGAGAFMNCTSLKHLYFPEGITKIREHVADGCSSLQYVYIPNSVTNLYGSALINCESLCDFTYDEDGYSTGYTYGGPGIYYIGTGCKIDNWTAIMTPFLDEDGTYYSEYSKDYYTDAVIYFECSTTPPDYDDDTLDAMQKVAHNRVLGIDDEYDPESTESTESSNIYGDATNTDGEKNYIEIYYDDGITKDNEFGSMTLEEIRIENAMLYAFNNLSIKTAKKTPKKLTIKIKKATYEYSNISYNVEVYKTKKAAEKGKKPIVSKKSSSRKIVIKSKKVNKVKKVFFKVRASRTYIKNKKTGKTKTAYGNWSKIKKVANKKAK